MADTTFVDGETLIEAAWLNDVNEVVYNPSATIIPASSIVNTPAGNIAAIDVQTALNELDSEKQPLDNELTALATSTAAANKIPMFSGTTTATTLDFKDEDNMVSDSATALPSQQSVKAYADNLISAATTATPDRTADYFLFEDATDNTQKKALLSTVGGITLATAQATTSGTTKDFTIPVDVKRITVIFNAVSTNSTSALLIQIGAASTPVVTGYVGQANYTSATSVMDTGFMVQANVIAANGNTGIVHIETMGSNIWVEAGIVLQTNTQYGTTSAGALTLGGTLDIIRVTTVGGDTFDGGSVVVSYE